MISYMNDIRKYIKYYEDVIEIKLCNKLINTNFAYKPSTYSTHAAIKKIKNDRVISEDFWIKENDTCFFSLKKIYELIILKYKKNYPSLEINSLTDFRITKYKEGGFMSKHVDNIHHSHGQSYGYPQLTGLLFLNDNYEGGVIKISGESFNTKAGSAILFPSNFIYPHEVTKITQGERYSITCWML